MQVKIGARYFDFDVNLRSKIGTDIAWPVFSANTGYYTYATIKYQNLKIATPRTDGTKTSLETAPALPKAGHPGFVTFRARDGRPGP